MQPGQNYIQLDAVEGQESEFSAYCLTTLPSLSYEDISIGWIFRADWVVMAALNKTLMTAMLGNEAPQHSQNIARYTEQHWSLLLLPCDLTLRWGP